MSHTKSFKPAGFLFILDPHATSMRPKRRVDDYAGAVLNKLQQTAQICREQSLLPVIPGDLFHRARENDLTFLSRMIEILRLYPAPPYVLRGSHDTVETVPTDKDALTFMAKLGLIRIVAASGLVASFEMDGKAVHLWGVPEGQPIPDEVDIKEGVSIMMTHHELDFTGPYPGSEPLKAIRGCDLLINGHLHGYAPPVKKGWTMCHNPGSMTRVGVRQIDQKPAVWAWRPENGQDLERIELIAVDHVFDTVGDTKAMTAAALKAALPKAISISKFASRMLEHDGLDASKTMDSGVLIDELDSLLSVSAHPDTLRSYLSFVINRVQVKAGTDTVPVKL